MLIMGTIEGSNIMLNHAKPLVHVWVDHDSEWMIVWMISIRQEYLTLSCNYIKLKQTKLTKETRVLIVACISEWQSIGTQPKRHDM